jgi:hypothetical protein
MAGAGDVILVMGVVAVPAGALIAYGTNFNGFKDWIDNMFSGGRFPPIIPISEAAEDKALANCPKCSGGLSKMVRSDGKCGCINAGGQNDIVDKGCIVNQHGFYNCNEGSCWRNTPCGGGPSVGYCLSGRNRQTDTQKGWLSKYGCKTSTPAPKPAPTSSCSGKSGSNCTYDCKNAYCWTSTGPHFNKACIQGTSNRTDGCAKARKAFLKSNQCYGLSGATYTACFNSARARAMVAKKAFAGRRVPIKISTSYR